jgi:hypothetical protein
MSRAMIGINATEIVAATAVPKFRLGTIAGYDHPTAGYQEFVYGRANGAVTGLGYLCVETTGYDFQLISVTATTPGTAGFGSRCAAAQAALADNEYGWFQIYGIGSLRTLASAAKGTRLNSTATNGAVDDDGGAGSEQINGLVLGTATGGAEATNTDAMFSYPVVGTTL